MTRGAPLGFELGFAAVMIGLFALGFVHSWLTRGRQDTLTLLLWGVGFGFLFPLGDTWLLGQYAFFAQYSVLGLPFHLGLTWFALYTLGLTLGERLAGPRASSLRRALVAAAVFGLLECQWDPVLLGSGLMAVYFPSFTDWPLGFFPGLPLAHVYFGFNLYYMFYNLRSGPRIWTIRALGLALLVLPPLGLVAMAPLFIPMFRFFAKNLNYEIFLSINLLHIFDIIHFSIAFASAGVGQGLLIRYLGQRLGPSTTITLPERQERA